MGKLTVVFFAILAIQAVCGVLARGLDHGHEEVKNLVQQVVMVSDELYSNLQGTYVGRRLSWENREFDQEISETVNYMEEMTNKSSKKDISTIMSIVQELREIRKHFKQLLDCIDVTAMPNMEKSFAMSIQRAVKLMESWVQITYEGSLDGSNYISMKTILKSFMFALRNLYKHVNAYGVHDTFTDKPNMYLERQLSGRSDIHLDFQGVIQQLETSLERVNFDNVSMKNTFVRLLNEYINTLRLLATPAFQQIAFPSMEHTYSVEEMKTQLLTIIKGLASKMERMPETVAASFLKATRKLQNSIEVLFEVSTEHRRLVVNMHTIADFLATGYEVIPTRSTEIQSIISETGRKFYKYLVTLVSKIEGIQTSQDTLVNLRRIMSHLEKDHTKQTLIVSILETTTEVHKFSMQYSDAKGLTDVLAEFVEVLRWHKSLYVEMCLGVNDVHVWSMHLMAMTNKMSMYLHGEVSAENMNTIMESFKGIFAVFKTDVHPEFRNSSRRLQNIIDEFQARPYEINTFLQNVAMELNTMVLNVHQRTGTYTSSTMQILTFYLLAIETVETNQRINMSLEGVQTPEKIAMKLQELRDRLTEMLRVSLPGFKHSELFYRGHSFLQMLDLVLHRLRKVTQVSETPIGAITVVNKNLRQIYIGLEKDLKQTDLYFKVKLGVYVQDTISELTKLAFEERTQRPDIVKLFADFLFGMRYLTNNIQYDFQFLSGEYSAKTLSMQIDSVASRLSTLLQRTQLKTQLKRVVLTQIGILSQMVERLTTSFGSSPGMEDLTPVYTKMYENINQVTKLGRKITVEELCVSLDSYVKVIASDLQRVSHSKLEWPELDGILKSTLIVLGNIMARLENVHHYEYYHFMTNTNDLVIMVRNLSSAVSSKLQNSHNDTNEIEHEIVIETLEYVARVEEVALHLQVEANLLPKGVYQIMSNAVQLVDQNALPANELKMKLSNYVMQVVPKVVNILEQETPVGTKSAMVKYIVALEKLYIQLDQINSHNQSLPQRTNYVKRHMHYSMRALQHIDPDNRTALDMLRTQYRSLNEYVTGMNKKLEEFNSHAGKIQLSEFIFTEADSYSIIESFKIKVEEYIERITMALEEISWAIPEVVKIRGQLNNSELVPGSEHATMALITLWDDLLMTVQYMRVELRSGFPIKRRVNIMKDLSLQSEDSENNKQRGPKYNSVQYDDSRKIDREGLPEISTYENFAAMGQNPNSFKVPSYRYGYFGSMGQHERPVYFGKGAFEHVPGSYEIVDDAPTRPKYFDAFKYWKNEHEATYDNAPEVQLKHAFGIYKSAGQYESPKVTNGILTLDKSTRYVGRDVTEDIWEIRSEEYKAQRHVFEYVRQFVEFLERTIVTLQEEKSTTNEHVLQKVIRNWTQIKVKLQELLETKQKNLAQKELSIAMEQVSIEIENLVQIARHSETLSKVVQAVLTQFYSYIRSLKTKTDSYASEHYFDQGQSGRSLIKTPWFYMEHVPRTFDSREAEF